MKNLVEFINEALDKLNLLKPKKENVIEARELIDAIHTYFISLKDDVYSLTNKQDAIKLFNGLKKSREILTLFEKNKRILSNYDIDTAEKFVKLLYNNGDVLLDEDGKYKWGKDVKSILQFNPTKMESDYREWLKSPDRVDGHKWTDDDYDPDTIEREIVIYDRKNGGKDEDTTLVYPFKGMRGKKNEHQLNMIRVDWCYKCGFKPNKKYFDAYSKLKENYDKYGPAKYEDSFEFDDI